jgi:NitT/TauT family transport system permease protein
LSTSLEVVGPRRKRLTPAAGARSLAGRYVPPLLVFAAGIVLWELVTAGSGRRVIPPPSAIVNAWLNNTDTLARSTQATFVEAIGGLVIGTLTGTAVAFASARWITARDVLLPIGIGASAVPIIAVAPILNNWFGVLNPVSKMMMAALLVFFPVLINVTRGLVEVQPASLELMRSYAASELDVLRRVRLPNMLPFFFTALKVGTTLAFIGALVGEYFGGTSLVLGRIVIQSMSSGRFDLAWAGILIGAGAAIVAYLAVALVERVAIPWHSALRAE